MGYMSELDIIIGNLAEAFVKQHGLKEDTVPLIARAMSAGAGAAMSLSVRLATMTPGACGPAGLAAGNSPGRGKSARSAGGDDGNRDIQRNHL